MARLMTLQTPVVQTARRKFLHQHGVVGIGVSGDGKRLIFMIGENDQELQRSIRDWAKAEGVLTEVRLTGFAWAADSG
jgi:hypothetical protein